MKTFKEFLTESRRYEKFSIYVINVLFHYKHVEDLMNELTSHFPIHPNDGNAIINVASICEQQTKIKLTENINEEIFPAHEDYALTILNKFFTSNEPSMTKFLIDNTVIVVTWSNIERLYALFHSHYPRA
jgi:hypothetical protein